MPILATIANMAAKDAQTDLLKAELLKLIEITHAEAGCLQYDLYQDNENPAHFVFCEAWASRDFLKKHVKAQQPAGLSGGNAWCA